MIINKKERSTIQKKTILDYLKSVKTHPSAKEVFKAVKKRLPQISLGTVYRILNKLKEKEQIFEIPEKTRRYDGKIDPHCHFICQYCNKVFDIQEDGKAFKIFKKRTTKIGKTEKCIIYFYGKCNHCLKGQKNKKNI